jgi:hypothetical protein
VHRSILPVVVGEYGAVRRWRIPLFRQIRSNRSLAGFLPSLPVKTLPLSVRICSGTPWRDNPSIRASHTGRAVARETTVAITQNLEWSSIPVMTDSWVPSVRRTPPMTSICHSSMGRDRPHRL